MPVKLIALAFQIAFFITASSPGQKFQAQTKNALTLHKVVVKEVLQTSKYTYLLVFDNKLEKWLALPKMQANPGETYYCRSGYEMTDFESKELGRKFESVRFLESISATPENIPAVSPASPHSSLFKIPDSSKSVTYSATVKSEREAVSFQPDEQGITIAELLANKEKYSGKTVRVKGKVTKFNAEIMDTNWIHIQDGTEFSGKFDLTATTDIEVAVGSIVTLEGKVSIGKDFGYGYSYEVLLENAKRIK